jgi:hypothetical protein
MTRVRSAVTLVLVLAAALAGCTSGRYVRETSQILSEDVVALRRDLDRYVEGQQRNAARRIETVLRQRRQREEVDEIVQAKLQQADGAEALHRAALARARQRIAAERARAEALAAERQALQNTQSRLDTELAGQLDELVEQLKGLSSSPSLKERAAFLVEYFKRTKKAIDAAEAAAARP